MSQRPLFAGPLPPLGSMSPMGATPKRARVNLPHTVNTLKTKLPPPIVSSPKPQPGQQGDAPVLVAAPQLSKVQWLHPLQALQLSAKSFLYVMP